MTETTAPEKPKLGEPCNGCGLCCASEVCKIGVEAFGTDHPPCPGMIFDDERFRCKLVVVEQVAGMSLISDALGIGKGCCADG